MDIARRLYRLQELDLEIESAQKLMARLRQRLGDDTVVRKARENLASAKHGLEEARRRQRRAEQENDDLVARLKAAEEQLYSGRIQNPKELTGLQHEVELLKTRRDRLDDNVLSTLDEVERAESAAAAAEVHLGKVETGWEREQEKLAAEKETLAGKLADLERNRQTLSSGIDAPAFGAYDRLRKQKGRAVARVEQGICQGCRISLPSSELQQVRSGNLVHCSSCGRILYLP